LTAAAVEMAGRADVVILVMGSDLDMAAEGHDLTNISQPQLQFAGNPTPQIRPPDFSKSYT